MSTQEEIEALLATKKSLVGQLRAVESELDKHRVKCPTCRCRILPGHKCSCCADDAWVDDLMGKNRI